MENLLTIKKILSEQLYIHENCINIDSNLVKDFNIDSIDIVMIIIKLEEKFLIKINEKDSDRMFTVKDIIEIIEKKQSIFR